MDTVFHCPLFTPTSQDEWDAGSSLQLINFEAQRFLEQVSKETDAAKKWNSEVTAALGLVAQSKENETKRLSEVQLVMEATSQGLKGHINKLEQMCLSLQESVQSLRAALSNAGNNTAQPPLAASIPSPALVLGLKDVQKVAVKSRIPGPCGLQFAPSSTQPPRLQNKAHLPPSFPERHSAPASLWLRHEFSSSSDSSRNDTPGSRSAQAATVRTAGCESEKGGGWSGTDNAKLQHQLKGRGTVSTNRQLTASMTAMCNEPVTRRLPWRQNTTSTSLGGRFERSTGFTARRATYQGPEGGNLLDDLAKEEHKGEVNDTPRLGQADSLVPTTRRPPLRRNTTSAFLGRRLERSIQIPARRATYQGPEKGSLLDDVAEEESEGLERDSSWQDMIAKRSLFSRTTESRRTEATSQWTAAYARVL